MTHNQDAGPPAAMTTGSVPLTRRGALAGLASLPAWAAAPVRLPESPYPIPEERRFLESLLRLGLRKGGHSDALSLLPAQPWPRQLEQLLAGELDVAALPAVSAEAYPGLLRVNVPLRLGLLGVRRLIARRQRSAALAAVRDIDALREQFILGYGAHWADLGTMQRLGFSLHTELSLEQLYRALQDGRVDYLSRGLSELETELQTFAALLGDIEVVPGIALVYPLDDCFYVSPHQPALHAALERGLRRAERDGSQDALIRLHYGGVLQALAGVRLLTLTGYPVPAGLPAAQLDGWRRLVDLRAPAVVGKALRLRVAAGQQADDPRFAYARKLLSLALNKAGVRAELLPRGGLSQPRQALELQQDGLDVGQLPVRGAVEPGQALPVRVPLRRGLLGVRLLLARAERAKAIGNVGSLAELQQRFTLGHGADWGDLADMRTAGFRVITANSYAALFRMLEAGRFDFISRAVSEVWDELARPSLAGSGELVVVPHLALYYPLDDFFWINPRQPELVELIEQGLLRARSDGSFDALYESQYGDALRRATLRRRRVLRLPGLPLPPLARDGLFDVLERFTALSVQAAPVAVG